MKTIGAFEAKTRLSELLAQVAAGETFVITKRGKVIAHLTPPFAPGAAAEDPLVAALRQFQRAAKPGKESMRELIDAGRKR
jgi:prevent-host-death family protein